MSKLAYKIPEAADRAGVSRDTIRKAIMLRADDPGHLPSRKVGVVYLVLHDDLVAWLDRLPKGGE